MRQLLRLLLYLAAGAVLFLPFGQSSYFESAPSCGYTQQQGFVHFEQSPELLNEPSLGLCGWGFDEFPQLRSRVDRCLSCSFTSADRPTCSSSTVLVTQPVWHLADHQECGWQGCWLGAGSCINGTAETTALCSDGSVNPKCCPFKRYVRCCQMLSCTQRLTPAGQCVVGDKDLLPGQQVAGRVFAVPTTSSDCYSYSFETIRSCQSNRTFATDNFFDSCESRPVGRDAEGCVKLPGYTFYRGLLISDASNWRLADNTKWSLIAGGAAAVHQAANDMPLMGGRCSATASCAAFQSTGNSTDILYQLPVSSYWVPADSSLGYCAGIYAKSSPSTSCTRISGYLFTPMRTLDLTVSTGFTTSAGSGPCSDCGDSSSLAARCDSFSGTSGSNDCAGFSNYHGLITSGSAVLTDQPMIAFTITPCVGMYTRVARSFPQEVEDLDQLLCGELVYCTSQLRYHASSQSSATTSASYYVDVSVDILSDLTLPRGLLDSSGGGLQQLPNIRSLTFRCHSGSSMLGGLPVGLVALMPFLQELRIKGCGVTGSLPSQFSQLRYLRVLDLAENSLTDSLPESWSNMTLGYLNLSSNSLTGTLPAAWLDIVTPQLLAPPPPPVPPNRASPPPSPPVVATPSSSIGELASLSELLVADLSNNGLVGAIPRDYVHDSCVSRRLRLQLWGEPSAELLAALGLGGRATFMLQGNPGVALWSGRYKYAVADLGGELHGGSNNLCGAYRYKIALGVLWGLTGLCFIAIVGVSIWRAVRAPRRHRGGFISDADTAGQEEAEGANAGVAGGKGRSFIARLWGRRWVRRLALLLRVGYLAADVALDIRVTVWLWNYGDGSSAAVCLAFLVVTQAAVSAALLASVWHHLFSSRLLVVLLSPLLVAVGPVVGPVLAVANIKNPDVPLVFWRYLELVEFCVALLQAPAESVTQSVVYARQNLMGSGMYMDHGLFVASIILSMGDMLIALLKLCSYKRGPLRRVLVAVSHLDKVRDPVDYRQRLLGPGSETTYTAYLETPLNAPGGYAARVAMSAAASTAPSRDASVCHSLGLGFGPPSLPPPSPVPYTGSEQDAAPESPGQELQSIPGDETAAAATSGAAPAAHTFTPLTAPRYKPSLLATSAHRLAGSGGPGGGIVVGAHSPQTLSRLGPSGSGRTSCVTIPAHPPLRPMLPSLPMTPTASRNGSGAGAETTAAEGADSGSGPATHTRARSGLGFGATDDRSDRQSGEATSSSGAAGDSGGAGISRVHHSLQEGFTSQQSLGASSHHLVGSISSDVVGLAGTGGVGPPSTSGKPAPAGATEADAAAASRRLGISVSGKTISRTASSSSSGLEATAVTSTSTSAAPSLKLLVPVGLSQPDESRYLASAAVAAEAALSDAEQASTSGLGSGASTPAGRLSSPRRPFGNAGAGPRRPVALRSGNVSPARRREGPSLSISVPASSVPDHGIEVIRMYTSSSMHDVSPASSRGAPTPTGWLPPPPQQPPPPSVSSLPPGAAMSFPPPPPLTEGLQRQQQREQHPQQPPEG